MTAPTTATRVNLLRPLAPVLADPRAKDPSGRCICDDRDFLDFSGAEALVKDAYDLAVKALDDLAERPGRQRKRRWWKRLAS